MTGLTVRVLAGMIRLSAVLIPSWFYSRIALLCPFLVLHFLCIGPSAPRYVAPRCVGPRCVTPRYVAPGPIYCLARHLTCWSFFDHEPVFLKWVKLRPRVLHIRHRPTFLFLERIYDGFERFDHIWPYAKPVRFTPLRQPFVIDGSTQRSSDWYAFEFEKVYFSTSSG